MYLRKFCYKEFNTVPLVNVVLTTSQINFTIKGLESFLDHLVRDGHRIFKIEIGGRVV